MLAVNIKFNLNPLTLIIHVYVAVQEKLYLESTELPTNSLVPHSYKTLTYPELYETTFFRDKLGKRDKSLKLYSIRPLLKTYQSKLQSFKHLTTVNLPTTLCVIHNHDKKIIHTIKGSFITSLIPNSHYLLAIDSTFLLHKYSLRSGELLEIKPLHDILTDLLSVNHQLSINCPSALLLRRCPSTCWLQTQCGLITLDLNTLTVNYNDHNTHSHDIQVRPVQHPGISTKQPSKITALALYNQFTWIGTSEGSILKLSRTGELLEHHQINDHNITDIQVHENGRVVFSSYSQQSYGFSPETYASTTLGILDNGSLIKNIWIGKYHISPMLWLKDVIVICVNKKLQYLNSSTLKCIISYSLDTPLYSLTRISTTELLGLCGNGTVISFKIPSSIDAGNYCTDSSYDELEDYKAPYSPSLSFELISP